MAERRKPTTRRRSPRRREPKRIEGVDVELRGEEDRPQDPLFVPHLEPLERALTEEGEDEGERYSRILETICGVADDSQPVEQYDGTLGVTQAFVANHQRAACQVQWNNNLATVYTNPGNVSGARWGTGTMISPDLMLTAGHLFDQTGGGWNRPRVNGTTNVISPQEIATNMHVNFNFQVDPSGTMRVEDSFAITQLIEYRIGGVDFAVCRIAGSPGNTYGWATVSTADAAVNDMLCLIGHPAGLPKRIEAGPCTNLSGNQILYNDIDTLGGNSGSGLLHDTTGQLVGVHTNGGCNTAGTGSNFGMRISAIRAQSPTITNLGAATAPLADAILTGIAADLHGGPIATLARFDKPIWDDIHTTVWRDIQPTRPQLDKPVWDDFGTSFSRDVNPTKRFDDVKAAGLDKQFDHPGLIDPLIDPAILGGMGNRPFALATPHHSPVLGAFAGQPAQQAFGEAGQLEAALADAQQALVELAGQIEALQDQIQGGGRSRSSG
jgi:V8-like Glu-specific endopeptidase